MLSFKVFSFPVVVYPVFFLGAFVLGMVMGLGLGWQMLVWIAVVFVSILVHELGHALIGKLFGGEPEIHLQMLGGVTYPRLRRKPGPLQQFVLSVAGPLAGIALGAGAWALARAMPPDPGSPASLAMEFIYFCSFVWAAFNLLPILPLDGGQMMLAVIEGVRRKPSEILGSWVSAAIALAAGLVAFVHYGIRDPFLLGWFALFAFQNFTRAAQARKMAGRPMAAPTIDPLELSDVSRATDEAREALKRGDFDAGLRAAAALENAGGPLRQAAGLRLRAGVELARGDNDAAALLAGQSFSILQNADSAVVAARANLRAGQHERALNWLRRAVEAGAEAAAIRADPELSTLIAG